MISPAEWHMYRNYTTLLCPGLLLRAPVPVESEPGHGASGEYWVLHHNYNQTRLSRAETGDSDHAPSAVISAQWHHYHYHHHYLLLSSGVSKPGLSFIAFTSYTYRPSNGLINFMLQQSYCTNREVGLIAKIWLFSTWFILCKSDISFTVWSQQNKCLSPNVCLHFSAQTLFFVSVGEFRILFSSLLVPVREQHVSCFINNRPIFVKQEFLIAITCAGQDKVSEYFQLKGFLSWTIQDFSVQVSVSGRKNLLDIFPFPVDWTNWDLNILMSHMTPFNSRGFSTNCH